MEEPVETSELLAFTHIVDEKSLSRAAEVLGVPRATISRRLARLEERLRTRLIRRTTRSLALTDAGDALYRHARIVLDAVGRAEASVRREDGPLRGELRVSVPPALPPTFHRLVLDFAEAHPEVRMYIHAASRHVDLLRDGYDVAIRASSKFEPGMIARKLSEGRMVAIASPAYLAQHGHPKTKRDLEDHRLLLHYARGEVPQTHWPWRDQQIAVTGAMYANEIPLLVEAAMAGHGIALVPITIAQAVIDSGLVEQVLPGILESATQVAVVYAERELLPPHVRAFVEAVIAWAPGAFADFHKDCSAKVAGKHGRAPLRQ